jgi:glycosyltransferase involved in cell wall biosynthesis
MVSKALVTGVYQKKVEELARLPGIDLRIVVPPYWHEERVGRLPFTPLFTEGYELNVEHLRFNGHHHIHYYPGLRRLMQAFKPDLVHIDEEPYNVVTAHAAWLARRTGARSVFFSWQNLYRRYPLPFRLIERYVYRAASAGIVGNRDAGRVLRRKGFRKPLTVIPQFGIDPELYQPRPSQKRALSGPVVGYVGRIVPEKGIDMLIQAVARIPMRPTLRIVGAGEHRLQLELLAERLGVRDRVRFQPAMPAEQVPVLLNELDVLVLPSLTQPNWKEQFGRVLIEAMACGVPVIGSESGEIPNVIGDAGLVVPEGDVAALALAIRQVIEDAEFARSLGAQGRERVLALYTQARVAQQTYALYRRVLEEESSRSTTVERG